MADFHVPSIHIVKRERILNNHYISFHLEAEVTTPFSC